MRKDLLLGCAAVVLATALGGCASNGDNFIYQALAKADKGWSVLPDYERGKRYLQVGDYGLAVEAFEQELQRDPASVRSLNGEAIAYQRIGRDDVAEKLFERALRIEPNSTVTLNNLAFLHMTHGDRNGALALVERAKAAPQDNATVSSVLQGNAALLASVAPKPVAPVDSETMLPAAKTVPVAVAQLETPVVAAAPQAAAPQATPAVSAPVDTAVPQAPAPQAVLDMPGPLVEAPDLPPRVEIASPKPTVKQPLLEAPVQIAPPQIAVSAPQPVLAESAAVAPQAAALPVTPSASAPVKMIVPPVPPPQMVLDMQGPLVPVLPPHVEITSPKPTAEQPLPEAPIRIALPQIAVAAPQPVLAEPAAALPPAATAEAPRPAVAGGLLASLNVVNGSGRSRLARHIGQYLTVQGFRVSHLVNASSFGQRQSVVFCHPASRQDAEAIARSMPITVKVVELKRGSGGIELVAGRDLDSFGEHLASLQLAQR